MTIAKAGTANHVERVVRGAHQALRAEEEQAEDVEKHWACYLKPYHVKAQCTG